MGAASPAAAVPKRTPQRRGHAVVSDDPTVGVRTERDDASGDIHMALNDHAAEQVSEPTLPLVDPLEDHDNIWVRRVDGVAQGLYRALDQVSESSATSAKPVLFCLRRLDSKGRPSAVEGRVSRLLYRGTHSLHAPVQHFITETIIL